MAATSGTKRTTTVAKKNKKKDTQPQATGLFLAAYECTTGAKGAPRLTLHLAVSTVTRTVNGLANVGWPVSPPVGQDSRVSGSYLTVSSIETMHAISLTGTPVVDWPQGGGVGPVLLPDLKAGLTVYEDWQRGVATFSFPDADGNWHTFNGVPVRKIEPATPDAAIASAAGERVPLTPDRIVATWADGLLTIEASGKEDGVTDITIGLGPEQISPPRYEVTGARSLAIGTFPYDVRATFPYAQRPKDIWFVPNQKVPVGTG